MSLCLRRKRQGQVTDIRLFYRVAFSLSFACLAGTCGCVSHVTPNTPPSERVAVVDATARSSPYPCANMIMVAATPLHPWADPDKTRYTIFRVRDIQVMRGPSDILLRASHGGGGLWPVAVWQETSGNIILAPGFNPEGIGMGNFWDEYQMIGEKAKGDGNRDADYVSARESSGPSLSSTDRVLKVSLVPLSGDFNERQLGHLLVDHSMLVFLLGLHQAWDDLHNLYAKPETKDGAALVCRTIVDMVLSHERKWPTYKWNGKERQVIDWCKAVVARN